MNYNHTQIGYLTIVVFILLIFYFGGILIYGGLDSKMITIMFLILILLTSFLSLNVKITEGYLKIKFGYGIHWKNIKLEKINSVRIVKNHWYYGWGIRYWLWPRMWIYNISGFDAVELRMKNGKIIRIGTDEPEILESAITQFIQQSTSPKTPF